MRLKGSDPEQSNYSAYAPASDYNSLAHRCLSMTKHRILVLVSYYLPGYKAGGPVRSIANLIDALAQNFEFWVLTRDRDLGDAVPYPDTQTDTWTCVGNVHVFYASPKARTPPTFSRIIRETKHDILYLNSLFDPIFTFVPLLSRRLGKLPTAPCIVAPRGELHPAALRIKIWKKLPYLYLLRRFGLLSNIRWHATSEVEAVHIRRFLGPVAANVVVAPNFPPSVSAGSCLSMERKPSAALRIIYLSRITRKKRLDFALRVLSQVRCRVDFNIYGPITDYVYWRECCALMQHLPPNVKAQYSGSATPDQVTNLFAAHDLFFFPTGGENFGHVVLESLWAGTPVLLSDQTPWKDDGMGGCIVRSLDAPHDFAAVIEEFAKLPEEARIRARGAAFALARKFTVLQDLKLRALELFRGE